MLAPLPAVPDALLLAGGRPRLGAWAGGAPALALPPVAGLAAQLRRRAREKRWVYLFAASPAAMLGVAVVEAGWFGGAFLWALDRARGALIAERSAAGLPGRNARVAGGYRDASARFEGGGLAVTIAHAGGRWRVRAAGGGGLEVDVALDGAGAPPPFTLAAPVPGAGPRVTSKAGGLAASGAVRAGRELRLDGGAGGVDVTAGLLARETAWRWAFGAAHAAGGPIAFNLCEGFGLAPDDPGEDALLAPGPHRLPPVAFAFDPAAPLAPWRVASADGAVSLAFRPVAVHREVRRLGVISTRFAQVAGTFDGALPGPGGAPLVIAGVPGVVEDHRARW